jgi:protein-S-isoprenylcysteine O-methyltransferase Ste14
MSLIPAFEIGVWNAWIFTIVFLLLTTIPVLAIKDFSKKMGQGEQYGKIEIILTALVYLPMIYSIFLPLKVRTAWFYSGLFIFLVGLFIFIATFAVVISTPLGTTFTKGIYRYSRNPGYLGQIIVFAGIGIASASWIFLLLSAILAAVTQSLISIEERVTQEKLGESYREYLNRTPRWIGIPRAEKPK